MKRRGSSFRAYWPSSGGSLAANRILFNNYFSQDAQIWRYILHKTPIYVKNWASRRQKSIQLMPRQSHRDRIYDLLVRRILQGEIDWDERLVDTALASDLGVSRMPVRDALMRLVAEGYLMPTTRGFTLPNLSVTEVLEVFELRRLLEPRAAGTAAQAMTETALADMTQALERVRQALDNGDTTALFGASETFRKTWLNCVPNQMLIETIRRYFPQVQKVRLTTMRDAETLSIILLGLSELLDAFAARDAIRASDRMLLFVIEGENAFRRFGM